MSRPVSFLALGIVIGLTACSDAELDSLDQRLIAMRDSPTGKVAPLPEAPVYRAVTYDQAGLRSPFLPERPEPEETPAGKIWPRTSPGRAIRWKPIRSMN
ncbi:hypothetical protein [Modicisalibacter luteus]|uniref:hypothetical protein n=1 Tax=Modicisalibacter luteus TaxID=453962 RepID=UPI00363CA8AA